MDFSGGFESKDIVFTKTGNEIQSGGFSVNSLFLKLGMSPLHTLVTKGGKKEKDEKDEKEEEEKLSKIMYDGFAVPIGLLCEHNNTARIYDEEMDFYYDYIDDYDNDDDVISDDFYDKLLGIQKVTNTAPAPASASASASVKTKKKNITRKKVLVATPNPEKKKHKKTRKKPENKTTK